MLSVESLGSLWLRWEDRAVLLPGEEPKCKPRLQILA